MMMSSFHSLEMRERIRKDKDKNENENENRVTREKQRKKKGGDKKLDGDCGVNLIDVTCLLR